MVAEVPLNGGPGLHRVQALVAELTAAAAELVSAPTWSLSVAERADALVEVDRAARVVDAARLAVIRSLDGEDLSGIGGGNVQALLVSRCLAAPGRARADVAAARATDPDAPAGLDPATALRDNQGTLVRLGQALACGEISRPHLDVAVRAMDSVPHQLRARAAEKVEDHLLKVSADNPPSTCKQLVSNLLDTLDPDRADRGFDPYAFERRRLDLATDSTGMLVIKGQLDPATGAKLKAAIDHYAAPNPATLDADGFPIRFDTRSPSQRRADAIGVIAGHAMGPEAGTQAGEPPRISVHVTVDQLAALTAAASLDGTPTDKAAVAGAFGRAWCVQAGFITPDVLARFACSAVFEKVLLAPNGAVLNLGRSTRLATPAQRRALAARDKGCVVPGCTRPANQCDAHHVVFWSHGGNTDIDELVLLCGPHHNAVHAGTLEIRMRDGIPYLRSRHTLGRQREWTRNRLHDHAREAAQLGAQLRLDHHLGLDPNLLGRLSPADDQDSDPPDGEPPPDPG
ncbi:MAG TPA: DUF222 domain-containing protein [Actinomycetales bacterium]|nr:DUF222 domain-containing protein [Actinomycetales bacterium]